MAETIEQKVAEAVLQKPIEITVGEKKFSIAPPSVATLILVSEAVSKMPHFKLDPSKVVEEALSVAKDCRPLGDILATLILGARHVDERRVVVKPVRKEHRFFFGLIRWESMKMQSVEVSSKDDLAEELLLTLSPGDLYLLLAQILTKMQIQDFFGLTTFLTEVNLLRQTTKVD